MRIWDASLLTLISHNLSNGRVVHKRNGREQVVFDLQVEASGEEVADCASPVG